MEDIVSVIPAVPIRGRVLKWFVFLLPWHQSGLNGSSWTSFPKFHGIQLPSWFWFWTKQFKVLCFNRYPILRKISIYLKLCHYNFFTGINNNRQRIKQKQDSKETKFHALLLHPFSLNQDCTNRLLGPLIILNICSSTTLLLTANILSVPYDSRS